MSFWFVNSLGSINAQKFESNEEHPLLFNGLFFIELLLLDSLN